MLTKDMEPPLQPSEVTRPLSCSQQMPVVFKRIKIHVRQPARRTLKGHVNSFDEPEPLHAPHNRCSKASSQKGGKEQGHAAGAPNHCAIDASTSRALLQQTVLSDVVTLAHSKADDHCLTSMAIRHHGDISAAAQRFSHNHPCIRLWIDVSLLTEFPGCFQRRVAHRLRSLRAAARFPSAMCSPLPAEDMETWYTPIYPKLQWSMGAVDACAQGQPYCGDHEHGPFEVRITRQHQREQEVRGRAAPLLHAVTQKLQFIARNRDTIADASVADTGDAAAALAMLAGEVSSPGLLPVNPLPSNQIACSRSLQVLNDSNGSTHVEQARQQGMNSITLEQSTCVTRTRSRTLRTQLHANGSRSKCTAPHNSLKRARVNTTEITCANFSLEKGCALPPLQTVQVHSGGDVQPCEDASPHTAMEEPQNTQPCPHMCALDSHVPDPTTHDTIMRVHLSRASSDQDVSLPRHSVGPTSEPVEPRVTSTPLDEGHAPLTTVADIAVQELKARAIAAEAALHAARAEHEAVKALAYSALEQAHGGKCGVGVIGALGNSYEGGVDEMGQDGAEIHALPSGLPRACGCRSDVGVEDRTVDLGDVVHRGDEIDQVTAASTMRPGQDRTLTRSVEVLGNILKARAEAAERSLNAAVAECDAVQTVANRVLAGLKHVA